MSDLAVDCALALYRLAGHAGTPLVRWLLGRRVAAGREDSTRLGERWGRSAVLRPPGAVIWIHGVSVGEALSALPMIQDIRGRRPGDTVLLTTATASSARLLADRLPDGVIHQFIPVDVPQAVRRFFDHWRPSLGIFIESEFWPALLSEASARGVTLVLVNGHMSQGSAASWARARPVIARLLQSFALVLAQSPQDAARLEALGAPAPLYLGNLKFAAAALDADPDDLAEFRAALDGRPCWLAASTHDGEERAAAAAHTALAGRFRRLLTLIAPRHPERGPEVAAQLASQGLTVARRSEGRKPGPETDIYIADILGEMGLWYRLAEVVFVGGSLTAQGGHNPLEPARLRCALITGPYCESFAQIASDMTALGALRRIRDDGALVREVGALLDDPGARAELGEAAERFALAQSGALPRIMAALDPYLRRVG